MDTPAIVDWRSGHPLMRFVSLDNIAVAKTVGVKTPSWAVSVVDSPQTPLILAGELGDAGLSGLGSTFWKAPGHCASRSPFSSRTRLIG